MHPGQGTVLLSWPRLDPLRCINLMDTSEFNARSNPAMGSHSIQGAKGEGEGGGEEAVEILLVVSCFRVSFF